MYSIILPYLLDQSLGGGASCVHAMEPPFPLDPAAGREAVDTL